MKRYILYVCILVCSVGCLYSNKDVFCTLPTPEIAKMYEGYVEEWKDQAKLAFEQAEKKVFSVKPQPKPDDGTNPDPQKCICKGTGVIVQGDGHKTACPYHGSKFEGSKPKPKEAIIREFKR